MIFFLNLRSYTYDQINLSKFARIPISIVFYGYYHGFAVTLPHDGYLPEIILPVDNLYQQYLSTRPVDVYRTIHHVNYRFA